MNAREEALKVPCRGETLLAVLSRPERPRRTAVVVVVGGPQYRAGSHRQFVQLARRLAAEGWPVLRFDARGMGDSGGAAHGFEALYCGSRGDPRIAGLCLVNPWLRSEASLARTHVRHYYARRLVQPAFWRKLLRGGLGWSAVAGLLGNVRLAAAAQMPTAQRSKPSSRKRSTCWASDRRGWEAIQPRSPCRSSWRRPTSR